MNKMNIEELIVAIDASTLDGNACDELVEILMGKLLENNPRNKDYFAVLETCKDDMKAEFEASPKIQLEIEQFTDAQMRAIAGNIWVALTEGYWVALRKAVEKELNAR